MDELFHGCAGIGAKHKPLLPVLPRTMPHNYPRLFMHGHSLECPKLGESERMVERSVFFSGQCHATYRKHNIGRPSVCARAESDYRIFVVPRRTSTTIALLRKTEHS